MSEEHKLLEQPAPGGQLPPEDTGSQALAEALRSSFAIVKWLMVVLVICFICSGMFQVKSGERAVRLHFGKPVGEGTTSALLGPGLHWSWPYPIDEVVKIKYSEIQKVTSTVGWYSSENAIGASLNPATEGYTLTSDGSIIHVRATLYYRIVDPVRYEFDFTNAPLTVQNVLDNSLVYASSRFTVDEVLTRETTRFLETVQAHVSELVDKQKLGIVIERADLETSPPLGLKKSFEDVVTALSTREKLHSDALAYTSSTTNQATAEAAVLTNTAQVERTQLVASVQAEAAYFNSVLPQYRANPSFVANLLLAEKLGQIMTNVENKFYVPERADGKTSELRLQLSREPQVSKPAAPAAPNLP